MKNLYKTINDSAAAMQSLLSGLDMENKKIFGYGAPAKFTTLSHVMGIHKGDIIAIADDSPIKQGLFTPGTNIPIVTSDELLDANPDYVMIFAWNFAGPIMKKLTDAGYKGKFIIPVPEPLVIDGGSS